MSVLAQQCYVGPPIYSAEQWKNKGALRSSSRLWKLYFILGVKCKVNPVCCSLLSLPAAQASRARRQSFPSNVYNAVGSSHLRKDSHWKCLQSCSGSSPRWSFSQQQLPEARGTAAFLLPYRRMCLPVSCVWDQGAKHPRWHGFLWQTWVNHFINGSVISCVGTHGRYRDFGCPYCSVFGWPSVTSQTPWQSSYLSASPNWSKSNFPSFKIRVINVTI